MTTKTINQFSEFLCPEFVKQKYPDYEKFIKQLLLFIDEKNGTGYFTTTEQEKANSIYKNYADLTKFGNIDDIPIENKSVLFSYYINWAMSYSTYGIRFQEDEYMRLFIKYSNILYRLKGTYKAYDFFIKLMHKSIIAGDNVDLKFERYMHDDGDTENAPPFYFSLTVVSASGYISGETVTGSITGATGVIKEIDTVSKILTVASTSSASFATPPTIETITGSTSGFGSAMIGIVEGIKNDRIVYTEIPTYYYDESDNMIKSNTMTDADQGKYPFKFQIASTNRVLNNSAFLTMLRNNLKPAGFDVGIYKDSAPIIIDILLYPGGIYVYNIVESTNLNTV